MSGLGTATVARERRTIAGSGIPEDGIHRRVAMEASTTNSVGPENRSFAPPSGCGVSGRRAARLGARDSALRQKRVVRPRPGDSVPAGSPEPKPVGPAKWAGKPLSARVREVEQHRAAGHKAPPAGARTPQRHAARLQARLPGACRSVALGLALALACAIPAAAQQIAIDLDADGSLAVRSVQLIVLITLLSLAPGLLIMVTCFPFIVTVLAILRQALGLQQSPPNMLIVSLALFLTWFVMEPVFLDAWEAGVVPLNAGELALDEAVIRALDPFRLFMAARIDTATYEALAGLRPDDPSAAPVDAPLSVLVPAFLLSEVARAFQIGFLIFLPFLIIDLVVAAVLMSMGMMMVPPAVVALPFKLSFFVVADGWTLISEALVRSYM